ncbi:MAG: hypothetical protein H7Y86_21585 [Rhizobacter sp.]|nr:hypothetical protein [Ferruginibacter sp.]
MQGIRSTEVKILLESLNILRQAGMLNLPEDQFETVIKTENELKEIYANYKISLQQVSENIRQFENHKLSIRRLMRINRHHLKDLKNKQSPAASAQ